MTREQIERMDQLTRKVSDLVQQKRKLEVENENLRAELRAKDKPTEPPTDFLYLEVN
jgi:hypothetical protein